MDNLQTSKPFIIAIDGPAGSGKTTTAKSVAHHLGFIYIDTGAMYRAVALAVLKKDLRIDDEESICELIHDIDIELKLENGNQVTLLNGIDVENQIRTPQISQAASDVSKILCVRKAMVEMQRNAGRRGNGSVLEGRDIGTVVFPDAPLKIFLVAQVAERANRRKKQLEESGVFIDSNMLIQQIIDRDKNDSTRENSPLIKAADAIEIDTTNLTVEGQVEKILELAEMKMHVKEGIAL